MDALGESDLKRALAAPGCPLCRLGEEAARRYLRFTLHESVNDLATRGRLLAAWGFCRRHAWHFLGLEWATMRDGLGTAMIAEGLVEAARQVFEGFVAVQTGRFRRSQAGRTSLEKLRRALTPTGPCPPCDSQVQHEGYALTVLLAVLEEEAWRERLALSDGLCLDHLRGALGAATSPDRSRWIIEDQRRRLSRIAADIEEYIRKHDYRFSHEPPGPERDVTLRATATLAGSWFELPPGPGAPKEREPTQVRAEEGKRRG